MKPGAPPVNSLPAFLFPAWIRNGDFGRKWGERLAAGDPWAWGCTAGTLVLVIWLYRLGGGKLRPVDQASQPPPASNPSDSGDAI